MTALVLKPFQVRRDGEVVQYKPGDRVPVKDPVKAAPLIREGYIKLILPPDTTGKPQAVRIFSELVGECIWLILDPQGMQYIREGEVCYTGEEIRNLRDATPEEVRAVHLAKKYLSGQLVLTLERRAGHG